MYHCSFIALTDTSESDKNTDVNNANQKNHLGMILQSTSGNNYLIDRIISLDGSSSSSSQILYTARSFTIASCEINNNDNDMVEESGYFIKEFNKSNPCITEIIHNLEFLQTLNNNKNIIHQKEFCESNSSVFSITHYCNGGDMLTDLVSRGKLSNDESKSFLKQVLFGLNILHSNHFYHGNLSLDKILIHKLVDPNNSSNVITSYLINDFRKGHFFIHHDSSHITLSEIALMNNTTKKIFRRSFSYHHGNPYYIAPEKLRKDQLSSLETIQESMNPFCMDIWSVGIILFMILTGRFLIDSDDETVIQEFIINYKNDHLHSTVLNLKSDIDVDALDLLHKILNPNPSERYNIQQILQHSWMMDASG
eukprot:gene14388-19311_t